MESWNVRTYVAEKLCRYNVHTANFRKKKHFYFKNYIQIDNSTSKSPIKTTKFINRVWLNTRQILIPSTTCQDLLTYYWLMIFLQIFLLLPHLEKISLRWLLKLPQEINQKFDMVTQIGPFLEIWIVLKNNQYRLFSWCDDVRNTQRG